MSSRIRIKMGAVEIEYEGTDDFLRDELLPMVKAVAEMYKEAAGDAAITKDNGNGSDGTGTDKTKFTGTTNQIATTLGGVSKGADLLFAAGVKLHFVDGLETFSRKQLLDEAKTATKFYKATYSNNLTTILQALVSGSMFNEPGANTYALTDGAITSAKGKLAQ